MHRLNSKWKSLVAVALCILGAAVIGFAINAGVIPLDSMTPSAHASEDAGNNDNINADAREPECKTVKVKSTSKQNGAKIGKGETRCFNIEMPKDTVLIAGGKKVSIANKSYTKSGGNTVAATGTKQKVTITGTGIWIVVKSGDAEAAWCHLLEDPKWGSANQKPLKKDWSCEQEEEDDSPPTKSSSSQQPSSNAKPASNNPPATNAGSGSSSQTVNGLARRGKGPFSTGEAVVGYFTMGGVAYSNCYIAKATSGGTVTDGVVNPWPGELRATCQAGGKPSQTNTTQKCETVNCLIRRGPGAFAAGEAVVGFFSMNGKSYSNCYIAKAPNGGTITDGVANPWPGEVKTACEGYAATQTTTTTQPQASSNCETVNCLARRGPGAFAAGEAVVGFFSMNGKSYSNCYIASATSGGTVTDGVVNPWKGEVKPACEGFAAQPSGSTAAPTATTGTTACETVNCKVRRGNGPFAAGEAVVGYFTMGGLLYSNCYIASAASGGTITDGVANPWKGEVKPACQASSAVSSGALTPDCDPGYSKWCPITAAGRQTWYKYTPLTPGGEGGYIFSDVCYPDGCPKKP